MIELYEGVPGSGKSYYAVAEKFLPAVRKGRRIYLYVEGVFLDRLALFTGIPLEELQKQITVWGDPLDVRAMHQFVEPQSLVLIDEAQSVFRAMEKVDKALLRWLETHRHHGVDILVCCQDYKQMSSGVTRLVEATIKFRRLALLGLQRHSQAKVRGNPEDLEVIRTFTFKYSPAVYAYYSSYSSAAIREEKRVHTIWKSAKVATSLAAGLFACGVFFWKPWTSLEAAKPVPTRASVTSQAGKGLLIPPPAPAPARPLATMEVAPVPTRQAVVTIIGTFGVLEGPAEKRAWRYLLSTGEALTAAQISGRYGLAVSEVQEGSLPRLIGEGVVYGHGSD